MLPGVQLQQQHQQTTHHNLPTQPLPQQVEHMLAADFIGNILLEFFFFNFENLSTKAQHVTLWLNLPIFVFRLSLEAEYK